MSKPDNRYKDVIRFLVKFIGIYLIGNIAYGLFIESCSPGADPVTYWVSKNSAFGLNLFGENVILKNGTDSPYISFLNQSKNVVRVFEGCNGLNVIIVYLSFLFAFSGPAKHTFYFFILGCFIIYTMNLLRVSLLYEVALHFPSQLYFFHKYLFTGILYLVVFAIWYFWVKTVSGIESGNSATQK